MFVGMIDVKLHGVDEALGVHAPLVARVGRSVVQHRLVDGVGRLVGEDAGGEHRNEFRDFVPTTILHDVVVDEGVFPVEFDLLVCCFVVVLMAFRGGNNVHETNDEKDDDDE
jgi:hypothetical protein